MRGRKSKNKNLPQYLYSDEKNGKLYYKYKPPGAKKFIAFGCDRREAINAAQQYNSKFIFKKDLLTKACVEIRGGGVSFEQFANKYASQVLPNRMIKGEPISQQTLKGYLRITKLLSDYFFTTPVTDITQAQIAEYLDTLSTAEVYNMHKLRLSDIYKHAISDGQPLENLPDKILKRAKGKVQRYRIDAHGYNAVYKYASVELRNAMELAINIMQRRGNLVTLRFDDVKENYLFVKILKTTRSGAVSRLRINTNIPVVYSQSDALTINDIIKNCKDSILSPLMIHRNPARRIRSDKKTHWSQVLPDLITREFSKAAKLAQKNGEAFGGLTTAQLPSLHECIALGEHLRKTKQNWTDSQLMAFRGHASEHTTRLYLDGHDWTTIDDHVQPESF